MRTEFAIIFSNFYKAHEKRFDTAVSNLFKMIQKSQSLCRLYLRNRISSLCDFIVNTISPTRRADFMEKPRNCSQFRGFSCVQIPI